jgi:hypothetical protein
MYFCSKKRADKIVIAVMGSSVVQGFRGVAKHFIELYENKKVVGPSGYTFHVTRETAQQGYANYLMDFERVWAMLNSNQRPHPYQGCALTN